MQTSDSLLMGDGNLPVPEFTPTRNCASYTLNRSSRRVGRNKQEIGSGKQPLNHRGVPSRLPILTARKREGKETIPSVTTIPATSNQSVVLQEIMDRLGMIKELLFFLCGCGMGGARCQPQNR